MFSRSGFRTQRTASKPLLPRRMAIKFPTASRAMLRDEEFSPSSIRPLRSALGTKGGWSEGRGVDARFGEPRKGYRRHGGGGALAAVSFFNRRARLTAD
jgi:hypothetical protein